MQSILSFFVMLLAAAAGIIAAVVMLHPVQEISIIDASNDAEAVILKLGFVLLSLYCSLLYIMVDRALPCDPGYAYHVLLPTLEDFVVALVALLFGTTLLNRLYQLAT